MSGGLLHPQGGGLLHEFPVADAQTDDIFFIPDDTHYIGYDSDNGLCLRPRAIFASRAVGIGGVATDPAVAFYNDGDCQFSATPLSYLVQFVSTPAYFGFADPLLLQQAQTTGNILLISNLADGAGADSIVAAANVGIPAISLDHNLLTLAWIDDTNTLHESTYHREFEMRFNTPAPLQLFGSDPDGSAAIGVEIGTEVAFTQLGAKIVRFMNDVDEKGYVDYQGDLGINVGANGQEMQIKSLTELVTIAAAPFTDSTIQIPANAVVLAVPAFVQVQPSGTATFDYGVAVATSRYGAAISTVAGSDNEGTQDATRFYSAATSIRITPNAVPGAADGRIRIVIHYYLPVPPTS